MANCAYDSCPIANCIMAEYLVASCAYDSCPIANCLMDVYIVAQLC